jgi:hypothetical protein
LCTDHVPSSYFDIDGATNKTCGWHAFEVNHWEGTDDRGTSNHVGQADLAIQG